MIAADTNVVLRLILADDEAQVAAIQTLMAQTTLFVSLTVLMETGWVLESRYRLSRGDVAAALSDVVALDGRSERAQWAIDRYQAGADWADMIHLAAAAKVDGFATLDRRLPRQAGASPPLPIRTLA